ncbi:hypothetical protein OHC33_006666 [Knufia fluminis]|uniref:Thiaminase-2/PQQC domain-containing protein n=1 Tax=Knufia fluminis TaxID=191047 RepID=A0AAN8EIE0_9EURO|nr:hypothetical protein OHC33_006666 [Knufia fluminis]
MFDLTSDARPDFDHERADSPTPQPLTTRLTSALLGSSPDQFRAATQHPFLMSAGKGTLSKHDLSRWLSQDRLYAETYISFITSLIARVTLPFSFISDKTSCLRWRIVNLLTGALTNIQREINFFTTVARKYDLRLDQPFSDSSSTFGPNDITAQYLSLFRLYHLDPDQSLLEGLLVLWATEKCYLEAWTYASTFLAQDIAGADDADGGALRDEFIPNWSSAEFENFVDDIADVTDELAQKDGALRKIEVYRALWLHVLEIEREFWPNVDVVVS